MNRKGLAVAMFETGIWLWAIGLAFFITVLFGKTSAGVPLISMPYPDALPEALILIGNNMIEPNSGLGLTLLMLANPLYWILDAVIMIISYLVAPKRIQYD